MYSFYMFLYICKGAASVTAFNHCIYSSFDPMVTRSIVTRLDP